MNDRRHESRDPASPSEARHGEIEISAERLAVSVGISVVTLARIVRIGVIEPETPGGDRFSAAAATRLRRMLRLRAQVGVNLTGASIIVDLLERLDRLEAELERRSR
jgi:hypothetical protein